MKALSLTQPWAAEPEIEVHPELRCKSLTLVDDAGRVCFQVSRQDDHTIAAWFDQKEQATICISSSDDGHSIIAFPRDDGDGTLEEVFLVKGSKTDCLVRLVDTVFAHVLAMDTSGIFKSAPVEE